MKKAGPWLLLALLAAVMILPACSTKPEISPTTPEISPTTEGVKIMKWNTPPAMAIDQSKEYTATIKTNLGDIVVQLFPKEAPITVNNFVFLAEQGFFQGVKFHRVVKGFVIQSGDPTGTGTGGPGYKFADEKVTRDYVAGTLAMANSGPNTNGSQFFITLADVALAKNYTIFGLVTGGLDIVKKIGDVPVKANQVGEVSLPTVDVHIDSVTIDVT